MLKDLAGTADLQTALVTTNRLLAEVLAELKETTACGSRPSRRSCGSSTSRGHAMTAATHEFGVEGDRREVAERLLASAARQSYDPVVEIDWDRRSTRGFYG